MRGKSLSDDFNQSYGPISSGRSWFELRLGAFRTQFECIYSIYTNLIYVYLYFNKKFLHYLIIITIKKFKNLKNAFFGKKSCKDPVHGIRFSENYKE